jgi:hypothetical protein
MSNTGINLAPNVRKGLHNHHDLKTLVTVITFVKKLKMVDELVTDAETDTHHSEIVAEDESQIVFNNDKNSAQVKNNGAERLIDPVTGDENRSIDGDTVQNNTEEPNITGAKMGKDNIVDDFKTMTEAQLGDMSDSHTTEQPITADSPASTPYRSENISVECTQTATAPALDALVKPAHNSSQNNEISNTFQETASPVNHNEGNVDSEGNTSNIKNTTNISNEQQKSIEEKNVENTIYDDAKGNIGNNSENQMKSTRVSR